MVDIFDRTTRIQSVFSFDELKELIIVRCQDDPEMLAAVSAGQVIGVRMDDAQSRMYAVMSVPALMIPNGFPDNITITSPHEPVLAQDAPKLPEALAAQTRYHPTAPDAIKPPLEYVHVFKPYTTPWGQAAEQCPKCFVIRFHPDEIISRPCIRATSERWVVGALVETTSEPLPEITECNGPTSCGNPDCGADINGCGCHYDHCKAHGNG
jgi:hypothetical protein